MSDRDHVITIAIGRIDADGNNLLPNRWNRATVLLHAIIEAHATVVATAHGHGTTTDQDETLPEETFIVIAVNPSDMTALRLAVAAMLNTYNLTSACCADDMYHLPVFSA